MVENVYVYVYKTNVNFSVQNSNMILLHKWFHSFRLLINVGNLFLHLLEILVIDTF